jgi:hypothetical protein
MDAKTVCQPSKMLSFKATSAFFANPPGGSANGFFAAR